MNWRTEWGAISARIHGIADAGTFYLKSKAVRATDQYKVAKHSLLPQTEDIYRLLKSFAETHGNDLPQAAIECLRYFFTVCTDVFSNSEVDHEGAVQFRITALIAFRSEFEYHLADVATLVRRQSERAFLHLQRSIVVDMEERNKWKNALEEGEIACEKLGAVRLLAHGIWAFKVDGIGARTDLVFQEPLTDSREVGRTADGLVLTEWKVCTSRDSVEKKIAEAKVQAKRYCAGVLAGIELITYRYLVIVSSKHVVVPEDDSDGGIIYRHINIAVEPLSPSKESRAISK